MAGAAARGFRALLTVIAEQGGMFLTLGRTDVGKSTLIRGLVSLATACGQTVVVLDADLGQSTYGLPTTLNVVRFSPSVESPAGEPLASVFVGAISPVGHLLQTLVGCRRLLDWVQGLGVQTILIDTTGLVEGPLGVEFKLQKIDLLRPTHLLALARGNELEPIVQACSRRDDIVVHELPTAASARSRSSIERRAYRQERYRRYFTGLARHQFQLDEVAVWGRLPQCSANHLTGLLTGLNDGQGFCLGVGLFHGRTLHTVEVLLPAAVAVERVKFLRFGSIAIDAEGNERFFSARA